MMFVVGASYLNGRFSHMTEIGQMAQWALVVLVLSYVVYAVANRLFG